MDLLLDIQHSSSGTPATGFGSRIRFGLESTTTANQDAAAIDAYWSTATHTGRTSRLAFATVNDGGAPGTLTKKIVIGNDASQTMFLKLQNQDTLSSGDLVKLYLSDSAFTLSAGFGAPLTISNAAGTNLVLQTAFQTLVNIGDNTNGTYQIVTSASNTGASVTASPRTAANIGLLVKGFASQSASLQEWQDSNAAVQASVGATGNFTALGTLTAGSGPTTLTDATGKILSAALNTVAVGQGGTGATTLTGILKGNATSAFTAATAGTDYTSPSSTETMTNKRITRRVLTTNAPGATPTFNTDNYDAIHFTGINAAITDMSSANHTGTPVQGDLLRIDFTDDGTARGITWGTKFEASGNVALPTTTVISTRLDVGFIWNTVTSKWRCVAVA